ncbi:hypothetical protein BDR07DRAFT_1434889 [Suillus spraguei]|nr:hypothetical protein BDR07DRAFT_1434889 [Suillus spraguei]
MTSASLSTHPVGCRVYDQTPYAFPSKKFMIVLDRKRCQLINKALDLPKPILFDFLVHGEILRTSLLE